MTTAQARDERVHRSNAAQVALARRDSPIRGGRHVGLAKALIHEMPHAYTALSAGLISEWRATLLVRETACLSADDRRIVDAELADRLPTMGDKQTAQAAMRIAQRLDAEHCVARYRKAVTERRISIRPAPDTMTYVSALLPVAHGVAVYAALTRHAATARATGDPRSRGQLMADELVTRITTPGATTPTTQGADRDDAPAADAAAPAADEPDSEGRSGTETHDSAGDAHRATPGTGPGDTHGDAPAETPGPDNVPGTVPACVPAGVSLDIQLVMTDRTLLDGDPEPATLTGYGPIPAPLARRLVRDASPQIKTWIRGLYTNPDTGHLITADSQRRTFPHTARQFLITRDQTCRTPYCDAPIRHADHLTPHAHGGPTHLGNGQGTSPARAATTPNKHPAGPPTPTPTTSASTSPPPPATPSAATRPHHHDPRHGLRCPHYSGQAPPSRVTGKETEEL